jgi:membrane dipeptidase
MHVVMRTLHKLTAPAVAVALAAAATALASTQRQTGGLRSIDPNALHESALVFAGHEHITNRVYIEGIDPWKPQRVGIWDYAKAKQGGVDVVVENIWAEPAYQPYNVTTKQVIRLLETFYQVLDTHRDRMELALSMADVRRIAATKKMAVILGLEAGWDMDGDLQVLRFLHRMGLRMSQFTTYTETSSYADGGSGPVVWHGINDQGRAIVTEMNRLGIVIDVSHASEATQRDVIETSAAPVTDSHRGLRHFVNSAGTMSDDTLKALARKGGVIGLHSSGAQISASYSQWLKGKEMPGNRSLPPLSITSPRDGYAKYSRDLDAAVKQRWLERYDKPWQEQVPNEAPGPTLDEWVAQVDYVISLVGEDHVAMGFDQSRGGGYFRDFDATKYPDITAALVRKGYSEARIRKILGGNWVRLFEAVEAVGRQRVR